MVDLSEQIQRALSAKGSELLPPDEALRFAETAASQNLIINSIEGYILKDDWEYAAPQYSLYGPPDSREEIPIDARIPHAIGELRMLIERAMLGGDDVAFQFWLAQQ